MYIVHCTQIPYTIFTIIIEHRISIACREMCLIYPLLKTYSYGPKYQTQTTNKYERREEAIALEKIFSIIRKRY